MIPLTMRKPPAGSIICSTESCFVLFVDSFQKDCYLHDYSSGFSSISLSYSLRCGLKMFYSAIEVQIHVKLIIQEKL